MKLNLDPGLFPTGDYKKDGLNLFSKFIRTKNVEAMQEEVPIRQQGRSEKDGKLKLKVGIIISTLTMIITFSMFLVLYSYSELKYL